MNAQHQSFRCPACDNLSHDETARQETAVLLCEHCRHTVNKSDLVPGDDGIPGVRPDPATDGWQHTFQAVYPDGAKRVFDLSGESVREAEPVPGTNFVLERWEVSDQPTWGGRFEVVGFLSVRASGTSSENP